MAIRKQLWHPDEVRFYVYAILNEFDLPVYVGKGSGRRIAASSRKHAGRGVILERFASERDESNIARFGVSKLDLDRCRQVAYG